MKSQFGVSRIYGKTKLTFSLRLFVFLFSVFIGAVAEAERDVAGRTGGVNPSDFIPQGGLCPSEERFLRRERSAAETTKAKIVTLRFLRP